MEKKKVTHSHAPDGPGSAGKEHGPAAAEVPAHMDDSCRCKEVSTKTPRELLRLMIGDLSFWKKANKE
jgi:hypothetical protein